MKICTKCNEEKSFFHFHKKPNNRSGYRSKCKDCVKIEQRAANIKNRGKRRVHLLTPEAVEKERKRRRDSGQRNKESVAAQNKRIRAQRKNIKIECSNEEVIKFKEENKYCLKCLSIEDLTLDHIIPVSWENLSRHNLDNFQSLCSSCNSGKNNRESVDLRPMETCVGFDLRNYL